VKDIAGQDVAHNDSNIVKLLFHTLFAYLQLWETGTYTVFGYCCRIICLGIRGAKSIWPIAKKFGFSFLRFEGIVGRK
jgi:hypothetical protein